MDRWRRIRVRVVTGITGVSLIGVSLAPVLSAQPPADTPPTKVGPSSEKQALVKAGDPGPPVGTILQPGENPIDLGTALRLAGVENPELLLARQRVTEVIALRQLTGHNAGPSAEAWRTVLVQPTLAAAR